MNQEKKVIHQPEILEPEDSRQNYKNNNYKNSFGTQFVSFTSANQKGCGAAFITFALFLISFLKFGILAAIGFIAYHIIISIIGSLIATRKLINGQNFNIWAWRFLNWVISFGLVAWQSGGFD